MVDIASISGAWVGVKTSLQVLQSAIELRDAAKIQGAIIELQTKILDAQGLAIEAQQKQSTLIDQIRSLEAEIADLKNWTAEKEQYKLEEVTVGFMAYVLKEAPQPGEPEHLLCTNCFQTGKKSILQKEKTPGRETKIMCPHCHTQIQTRNSPEFIIPKRITN
jgi:hypothetical protein